METYYFDNMEHSHLNQLKSLLTRFNHKDAFNLEALDGFFAALHCCPELITPSNYLPEIWGGGEMPDEEGFDNDEQAKLFFDLTMNHWNLMADRLEKDDVFLPVLDNEECSPGNRFAIGFLKGMEFAGSDWIDFIDNEEKGGSAVVFMALANEHNPDPKLRPYEKPITLEQREILLVNLSAGVMSIFKELSKTRRFNAISSKKSGVIRNVTPKVGRNSPCPCGSGKKYKKCCSQMLEH